MGRVVGGGCSKEKKVGKHWFSERGPSSYPTGSGRIGGRVCRRARPRLVSEPKVRTLSWSESSSGRWSRPRQGRAILGREPSWREAARGRTEHLCGWEPLRVCVCLCLFSYLEGAPGVLIQGHGSIQVSLIQLPHVHVIQLLEVSGDQEAVVCNTHTHQVRLLSIGEHSGRPNTRPLHWLHVECSAFLLRGRRPDPGPIGNTSPPGPCRKARIRERMFTAGGGRTVDEPPLLLDDVVAQEPVLLVALHRKVLLADDVVLEQGVRLHLGVADLQLVDLAEEAQHLALLLGAHPARQQLLQALGALPQLQEAALQRRLVDRRRNGG